MTLEEGSMACDECTSSSNLGAQVRGSHRKYGNRPRPFCYVAQRVVLFKL